MLDSQSRALVAGAVTQNGKLRGYVVGRKVDVLGPPQFDLWYPGAGPSEALGIVRAFGNVGASGGTSTRFTTPGVLPAEGLSGHG